ncbi:unnamed protein product [Lampetra planeri]
MSRSTFDEVRENERSERSGRADGTSRLPPRTRSSRRDSAGRRNPAWIAPIVATSLRPAAALAIGGAVSAVVGKALPWIPAEPRVQVDVKRPLHERAHGQARTATPVALPCAARRPVC